MRVIHVIRNGRDHEVVISELPEGFREIRIAYGLTEMRARQCAAEIRDAINTATGSSLEYETVER